MWTFLLKLGINISVAYQEDKKKTSLIVQNSVFITHFYTLITLKFLTPRVTFEALQTFDQNDVKTKK